MVLLLLLGVFVGGIIKIYRKLTTNWCESKICLVGKTALVTGANTGIGYETALDFAMRGARVVLACRDAKRGEDARTKIVKETGNENVVVKLVNMNSFKSVRAFAKEIIDTENQLDILVNNAGVIGIGDEKSEDRHVLVMQINYFSSFLLTLLLIGLMKKTGKGRIVNVSSLNAKFAKGFDVKNVDKFPGIFNVYNHSKLCNILFTIELAEKLKGTDITTYSLHPGAVKTEILRYTQGILGSIFRTMQRLFYMSTVEGAQTTIYCSIEKGIENSNGEHFADCKRVTRYKTANVPGLSKKLWEVTENIVQLKPDENPF